MTAYDLALVALLLFTFVLAAMAASAETALTSISRLRLRKLVEEGNLRAALIERLHQEPNDYLTAILTFNTTAIVLSATAAGLIANDHGFGSFLPQLLVSLVDAAVVLIFAEITAKSLALTNIRYALFVAPAVGTITSALRPLLRGMSGFARLMARVRGTARGPFVTEDELMVLLSVGEEEGVIEEEEREMIHGIIEIGDKSVREVMVPRVDIDAVEVHRPVQEIIDMILKQGHTRVPVFEGDIDHIIGIAYAKDLLRYRAERRDGDVRSLLRPAYFVPENRNLSEFLHEMRQNRVHMAVVLDEYGGVSGLVTIEDIIEEIVGPIRDEYDAMEEEDVHFTAPNEAVLDARIGLGDARELLGLELAAEDVDSLGGFILSRLGRVARSGESIEVEGAIMTVVNVLGQRIGKVRVRSQTAFPGAERDEGAEVSTTEAQPGTRKAG